MNEKGRRKIYFTVGGLGTNADPGKRVHPGNFSKKIRFKKWK